MVYNHVVMLQGIIARMANNSANCKAWTVTIVAAMLVLLADGDICSARLWVCYVPVVLFYVLDGYYLGLERFFRRRQQDFMDKVPDGSYIDDLYLIKGRTTGGKKDTIKAMGACSTFPFYGLMALFIGIVMMFA